MTSWLALGRWGVAALTILAAPSPSAQDAPPWPRIRAVLETRCLRCHGGEKAESGLRFANRATFRHGGARGPVVDAADPAASRLLAVIGYGNPDLAMPPDGKLPDPEIELLDAWVRAGAPWPADAAGGRLADPDRFASSEREFDAVARLDWWAYRPLRAEVPDAPRDTHPIDAFVQRQRAAAGIAAPPPATPDVLVRRVTFDLIGLPPTPDERTAFAKAVAQHGFDAAWTALVDRLLASPRYGEHQARHWLDLVRYAETNGYERDGTKTNMWRYRDWVIRAFHDDKPYDRFALEQLAGDELASYAPDLGYDRHDPGPRIASGYFRLGVWDDEPADPQQALADELADIVDTTSQVFLAASFGCARCHDHKADPISQRDYYALTAYFNNLRGFGGDRFAQSLGGGIPEQLADPVSDDPAHDDRLQPSQQAELLAPIEHELTTLQDRLWTAAARARPQPRPTVLVADARRERDLPSWRYTTEAAPDGWQAQAFDDADWATSRGGFGTAGTPGARIGRTWDTEQIWLRTRFRLTEIPASAVLSVHHDEDVQVFLNGALVFERRGYVRTYLEIQLPPEALTHFVVGSNVLAVSCRQSDGGQFVDVGLRDGWFDRPEGRALRLVAEAEQWLDPADATRARELLAERARIARIPVARAYPALVASERGATPPPQHLLLRGSVHAPGDVVEPAVAAAIAQPGGGVGPEIPTPIEGAGSTGRRTAFARWLFGAGRALTARVIANRLWQFHFGRGLCRSAGDFGRFGEQPTHPELLDHLAQATIERGWSLKAMHRYILASDAYRATSTPTDTTRDPRNDHYGHFDPRRLTAEEYRDAVLAVSGLATHALYGPSVFPPLPAEVLATASRPDAAWGSATPEEAARRSIYVFAKRSLRVPLLEGLDQPDPDLPCSERFPTNVPTQALMTLNGDFTHDAARAFAARLVREAGDDRRAQLARGVELAFGRAARTDEIDRHAAFVARLRAQHGLDDATALSLFCLALFNLNEFLWID